jgi:hypothetical protein
MWKTRCVKQAMILKELANLIAVYIDKTSIKTYTYGLSSLQRSSYDN